MWYVYILLCADGSLYTGSTNDVEKRFKTHLAGKGGAYTRSHKPVKIVYQETLSTKSEALKRELEIKSWTRGKKIVVLSLEVSDQG
jgi:putative endonuclease